MREKVSFVRRAPLCFSGGLQLFCTGTSGEYLGNTDREVKARPRFFIEQFASQDFRQRLPEMSALSMEKTSC
jgi:hypothetical protein